MTMVPSIAAGDYPYLALPAEDDFVKIEPLQANFSAELAQQNVVQNFVGMILVLAACIHIYVKSVADPEKEFIEVCEKGDFVRATALLWTKKVDINAIQVKALSPFIDGAKVTMPLLLKAVGEGNFKVAEFLIYHGACLNAQDEHGNPLLRYAIESYNQPSAEKMVRFLLSKGASAEQTDRDGNTMMHYAAGKGHLGIIQALHEHGANVNAPNLEGLTPLHATVFSKQLEAFRLLRTYQADTTIGENLLLYATRLRNRKKLTLALIAEGLNPNVQDEQGRTLLHKYVGIPKMVEELLRLGANPLLKDVQEQTPLHLAASINELASAAALIEANPSLVHMQDRMGATPLHMTPYLPHGAPMVNLLLSNGAVISRADRDGTQAIHTAAYMNNVDVLRALVERPGTPADINAEDSDGNTPLHLASLREVRSIDAIHYLLQRGAVVKPNRAGQLPNIQAELSTFETEQDLHDLANSAKQLAKSVFGFFTGSRT